MVLLIKRVFIQGYGYQVLRLTFADIMRQEARPDTIYPLVTWRQHDADAVYYVSYGFRPY